jgi:hypothetical protein
MFLHLPALKAPDEKKSAARDGFAPDGEFCHQSGTGHKAADRPFTDSARVGNRVARLQTAPPKSSQAKKKPASRRAL